MKVISLWQPWASAIILDYKNIETRSRNTHLKGEVGIHASQKPTSKEKIQEFEALCKTYPFNLFIEDYNLLPFGCILGTTEISGTCHTEFIVKHHSLIKQITDWNIEKLLGDYTKGRYGYALQNSKQFIRPIPAKGSQILGWNYDVKPLDLIYR